MIVGRGKQYITSKNCCHICIRVSCSVNFYKHVGFTIRRRMRLKTKTRATLHRPFPPFNYLRIITDGAAGGI